ncbi:MAG: hypothetical protein JW728_06440 [Candidatus Aureabacteria bacterium]|nr:hypothetical protein [Candidatus Auribacterota bacterium]
MRKIFSRKTALFVLAGLTILFLSRTYSLNLLIRPVLEWRISAALGLDVKVDNIAGGLTQGLCFENMKIEGRYRNYNILLKTKDVKSNLTLLSFFPAAKEQKHLVEIDNPVIYVKESAEEIAEAKQKTGISPEFFEAGILNRKNVRLRVSKGDVAVFNRDGSLKLRTINIKGELNSESQNLLDLGLSGEFGTDGSGGSISVKSKIDIKEKNIVTNVGISEYQLSLSPRVFDYLELLTGTLDAEIVFSNDHVDRATWLFRRVSGKFLKGTEKVYDLSGKIDIDAQKLAFTGVKGHIRGGNFNFDGTLSREGVPVIDGNLKVDKDRASASIDFRGPLDELLIKGSHGIHSGDVFIENISFSLLASSTRISEAGFRISAKSGKFNLKDKESGKISGNVTAEVGHLVFDSLSITDKILMSGDVYYSETPAFNVSAEIKDANIGDVKNFIKTGIEKNWIDDMPVSGKFSIEGDVDNWTLEAKAYIESKFDKVELKGKFRGDNEKITIEEMTIEDKLKMSGYFGLKPDDKFKIDFSSKPATWAEYKLFLDSKNRTLFDECTIEGTGTLYGEYGNWSLKSNYVVNLGSGSINVELNINDGNLESVFKFENTRMHSLPVKTQIELAGNLYFDNSTRDFYVENLELKSSFLSVGTLVFDDIAGKGRIKERRLSIDSLLIDKYISAKGYFDFNIPAKLDFIFEFDDFQLAYLKKLEMEPSGTRYGGLISGYLQMKGNPSYIYTTGKVKIKDGYSGTMKVDDVYITLDGSGPIIDLPNSRAVIDGRGTKVVGFIDLNEDNIFNNVDFELPDKIMNWYNRDVHIN